MVIALAVALLGRRHVIIGCMASRAYEAAIEQAKARLWVRWIASIALVPVLGGLSFLATSGDVQMGLPASFQYAMLGATALMTGMAIATPRMMMPKTAIIAHMRGTAKPSRMSESMEPREERLVTLFDLYLKPFKTGLLFASMVTLLGFVYVLVSGAPLPFLAFGAISLAVHALHRPHTFDDLMARSKRYAPEDRPPPPPPGPRPRPSAERSPSERSLREGLGAHCAAAAAM